jgi:hypothetical protein
MMPILRKVRNAFFVFFALLILVKTVFQIGDFEFVSVRLNYGMDLLILFSLVVFSLWVFLYVETPWQLVNRLKDTLAVLGIFGTIMISVIYVVLALGIFSRGIDPSFMKVASVASAGGPVVLYRGPGNRSNDFSITVRQEKEFSLFRAYSTLLEANELSAWTNFDSNGMRLLKVTWSGGSNQVFFYP